MPLTKTTTLQPIPYLAFDGNCKEAMEFYATVLGGEIRVMMAGKDAPIPDMMTKEFQDRILNAQLELPGGGWLYAGDAPPMYPYSGIHGCSLALNFETTEEAEEIFNKLANGGKIHMPFEPTFWAEKFGMVTDKFGVGWVINGVLLKM